MEGHKSSSDDDVSLAALVRLRAKRKRVVADESDEESAEEAEGSAEALLPPPQQRGHLSSSGRKTRVPPSSGAAHRSTADGCGSHDTRAAQHLDERETDAHSILEQAPASQPQSKLLQQQVSTCWGSELRQLNFATSAGALHRMPCTLGVCTVCAQPGLGS